MVCPVPPTTACARLQVWSCARTYDSCTLVIHDNWIYGTKEDITEPSALIPSADERFTKGMLLDEAVKWLATCSSTDTYDMITRNPNGSFHVQRIDADGNVIEEYDVGSASVLYSDSTIEITDNGDGTITYQRMVDGVPVGSPVTVDYTADVVDTFGTMDSEVQADGSIIVTFHPADGGPDKVFTIYPSMDSSTVDNGDGTKTVTTDDGESGCYPTCELIDCNSSMAFRRLTANGQALVAGQELDLSHDQNLMSGTAFAITGGSTSEITIIKTGMAYLKTEVFVSSTADTGTSDDDNTFIDTMYTAPDGTETKMYHYGVSAADLTANNTLGDKSKGRLYYFEEGGKVTVVTRQNDASATASDIRLTLDMKDCKKKVT